MLRLTVRALAAALALACLACVPAASAHASTVWLCRPGLHPDPCTPGLSTTNYTPTLKRTGVAHPKAQAHPPIDCFYVYPTVSDQKTGNANLHIDPIERSIALYQVARYSQYCRVFAPMYRQQTLAAIAPGGPKSSAALALSDVRAAFANYLRHDNRGRGIVLIGHSQGAFVLRQLIARDIDFKPAVRKLLVSAILLGGNVLVKPGAAGIGGDFKHIPACRSAHQLECVIAFSTFDAPPPKDTIFGKPGILGHPGPKGDIVLCTNPAALGGGSGLLDPIFPSAPPPAHTTIALAFSLLGLTLPHPKTVWGSAPGAYTARCINSHGAHVLLIAARHGAQVPRPSPTAMWGLHLLDASIALGNLAAIVHSESLAFAESQAVAP